MRTSSENTSKHQAFTVVSAATGFFIVRVTPDGVMTESTPVVAWRVPHDGRLPIPIGVVSLTGKNWDGMEPLDSFGLLQPDGKVRDLDGGNVFAVDNWLRAIQLRNAAKAEA